MSAPMVKYRIWDPAIMGEDEAETFEASRPQYAAENWVKQEWVNLDYPNECEVWVKAPDGTTTKWAVTIEQRPHFSACEVKGEPTDPGITKDIKREA